MQGCWQRGTDKDQASEDQDQNQGTHAPDQQRQLQIPHFGVGFGQSEIQASVTDSPRQEPADSLTAQQSVGEKPSSIDEILAQSPPSLEQPGDPSLYYLGLLQNQNQLHHQHHRAQQYQGFPGDDPSISTHQQPQPLSFGQHQHQHHQPPACSSPPLPFSFPFPSPPASAPATSAFGLAPPPPLPLPATPPIPPPRRRFQPTTSRRQQNQSHCRSNSNLSSSSSKSNSASASRRLLASRSPASQSASGKTPRQRLPPPLQPIDCIDPQDTPTAHRRHSPFLPPHPHPPPSSLSACSTLSALSTSSPSSPIPGSISSSPALLSTFSPISSSSSYQTCSSAVSSPHINMSRASRNPPPASAGTGRQNEYFVPRDGIDREVISADICRYLGNDALVRPGHYENPQTGQAVQGYYITAYRNLTTAMIEDLKADSARWDSERRAQTSRNTSGGTIASRNVGVPPRHSSNSPVVQYRYSETHQSRQHHGPTEGPYSTDPYARDSGFDGPRYPGTGAPGYTGAAGSYSQSYGGSSSGFAGYTQAQQSPPPADSRFSSTPAAAVMNAPYQAGQSPYVDVGTNQRPRGYDAFANQAAAAAAAQQQAYATSAPSQPGYPATAAYQYSGQAPPAGYAMQPQDPFYGRAGQPAQGYTQASQYEETPRARASATPTNTQTNPSGTSSGRRSERESDRHSSDRHHRSSRR